MHTSSLSLFGCFNQNCSVSSGEATPIYIIMHYYVGTYMYTVCMHDGSMWTECVYDVSLSEIIANFQTSRRLFDFMNGVESCPLPLDTSLLTYTCISTHQSTRKGAHVVSCALLWSIMTHLGLSECKECCDR